MSNTITEHHVGKRLLVTDRYSGISRDEIQVLEVSPSGRHVKLRNVTSGAVFWRETEEYRIAEELATETAMWQGRAGNNLEAMLEARAKAMAKS